MWETLLYWLSSLRTRLIVTYVLVTALSFGLLILLLIRSTEQFLMQREEDNLKAIAITLGTTIRSPVESTPEAFNLDLHWTQRRCRLYLNKEFRDLRFRVLDARGTELIDSLPSAASSVNHKADHSASPQPLPREITDAIYQGYGEDIRYDRDRPGAPYSIFMALPIYRYDTLAHQSRIAFIMYLDKPVSMVYRNLGELRHQMLVGMLASLLLTIVVSIVFSSNLSAGIRDAVQVARALAAGQMDGRMRESGHDEVGQLGKAFNQMADNLQRQESLRRNLLADVSHELRTPLTAIAGCADTLSDGTLREDPAVAERFLDIIVRESERLQRLVCDILELSKLQAGVLAIPLERVPVIPLLEDAIEIAQMQAEQDGITIACQWPESADLDTLTIMGNEDRLAQALRNLLDNARHHSPREKTISIMIELLPQWVRIHIRDEGNGIPAEELPWVFDRFYRAGRGIGTPGGTGLGLAIVREIMLAHHGRVTVESTVGVGTTFSLHLPRIVGDDEQAMELSANTHQYTS